jgi:hypothetical protein
MKGINPPIEPLKIETNLHPVPSNPRILILKKGMHPLVAEPIIRIMLRPP